MTFYKQESRDNLLTVCYGNACVVFVTRSFVFATRPNFSLRGQLFRYEANNLLERKQHCNRSLLVCTVKSRRYEANLIFWHLRERCIVFSLIPFNRSDFVLYTSCAVFLGRHDINKTIKDMHLCSCYEQARSQDLEKGGLF